MDFDTAPAPIKGVTIHKAPYRPPIPSSARPSSSSGSSIPRSNGAGTPSRPGLVSKSGSRSGLSTKLSSTPRTVPAASSSSTAKQPIPSSSSRPSFRPSATPTPVSASNGVKRKATPLGSSMNKRTGVSVASSRSSTPKRRPSFERVQSESESESDSMSSSSGSGSGSESSAASRHGPNGTASPRKKTKTSHSHASGAVNGNGSAKSASRSKESDRSRSTSKRLSNGTTSEPAGGTATGASMVKGKVPHFKRGRNLWSFEKVDGRGEWGLGWAGFTTAEEAVRKDVTLWDGGKGKGAGTEKYEPYFNMEGLEVPTQTGDQWPVVEVLYPAKDCRERFPLILPTGTTGEYNPMGELRAVLTMIFEHYIPPSHRDVFGYLSTSIDAELSRPRPTPTPSAAPSPPLPVTALPTQVAGANGDARGGDTGLAGSEDANGSDGKMVAADTNVSSHFAGSTATPFSSLPPTPSMQAVNPFDAAPPASESSTNIAPSLSTPNTATRVETIAATLRRAWAPNKRDGPAFVAAIERYNAAMADLQKSGDMERWLDQHAEEIGMEDWSALCERVNEMAYARVVGPYSNELEHHPKHPEEVAKVINGKEDSYGELRHNFMSTIISLTKLSPSSVFLDLGSGVGNCVVQTALQAGCASYGVELLPIPSHCARLQLQEAKRRWLMWGLKGNREVEVLEGDMRGNGKVVKWIEKADVILVNNEVFSPELNDSLKYMFLDMKETAKIVSLKPFANESLRKSEFKSESWEAGIKVTRHTYYQGWVSWKGDMGEFYVHELDRAAKVETKSHSSSRSSRSRR